MPKYRKLKDECDEEYIPTRLPKSQYGLERSVWWHGDGVMAALMPNKTGKTLINTGKITDCLFTDDGTIVFFRERDLTKLAKHLKMRTMRTLNPEQKEKAIGRLRAYRYSKKDTHVGTEKRPDFKRTGQDEG